MRRICPIDENRRFGRRNAIIRIPTRSRFALHIASLLCALKPSHPENHWGPGRNSRFIPALLRALQELIAALEINPELFPGTGEHRSRILDFPREFPLSPSTGGAFEIQISNFGSPWSFREVVHRRTAISRFPIPEFPKVVKHGLPVGAESGWPRRSGLASTGRLGRDGQGRNALVAREPTLNFKKFKESLDYSDLQACDQ